eukprot:TRINITY_DN3177_c0_g1_i1.p2 TRINITY_DN3177_c0_g1~~TRINITY_DN3177_c0_g1_i1.p2  ORF type:complete len:209 (+),score=88.56 TRINITY_DN3177_c0_g1_i1:56-628(+)
MVRTIRSAQTLKVFEGVTVELAKRVVTVKGPRGELTRSFKHVNVDLKHNKEEDEITAEVWFGKQRNIAGIKTVLSHITNMMIGVTKGYKFKLRFAYAHFPVGVTVEGKNVEVRNFLGEKYVRRVPILGDCKVSRTEASVAKDELVIQGNDITDVSQTAANVHGACLVKRKDIRKFLDGIYTQSKGNVVEE